MKFRSVKLGDWFGLQKGISYTSANLVASSDTGLLTINAFHLGGGFKVGSEKPFSQDLHPDFVLNDGDVLFAMTEQDSGLLASPLLVDNNLSDFETLTFSLDVARLVPKSDSFDARFVYNVMRIPAFRKRAAYGDTGSTVQRLPYEALAEFEIPMPDKRVQRAISDFIELIDAKIQLNVQLSKTLEAIAQATFKSWFMDFEPVIAKARGEQPEGIDEQTANLFPSAFEESGLGLVPTGWEWVKVDNLLARCQVKALPKSTELQNVGATLVLEQGGSMVAGFVNQEATVSADSKAPRFIFGDHTCRMRISTLSFCVFPNTIVLESKLVDTYWAFQATKGLQKFESYRRHWMELAQKSVLVPSVSLTKAFGSVVMPLYAKTDALLLENRYLAELRDSLLPRLISGELEIPEELLGE